MKKKCGCESGGPRRLGILPTGALILCTLSLDIGGVSGRREKSARDGVYTDAQADRGAKLYNESCVACHETSRFVGEQMRPWENQPAYRLFNAIRLTMPEEAPGSLTRQQCADLLAYIFRLNGFKAGPEELESTDEALKGLQLEGF